MGASHICLGLGVASIRHLSRWCHSWMKPLNYTILLPSDSRASCTQWTDLEYVYTHSCCSKWHKPNSAPTGEENPGEHSSASHMVQLLKGAQIQALSQTARVRKEGFSSGCICLKGPRASAPFDCSSFFWGRKEGAPGVLVRVGCEAGCHQGQEPRCKVPSSYPTHWLWHCAGHWFLPIFLSTDGPHEFSERLFLAVFALKPSFFSFGKFINHS